MNYKSSFTYHLNFEQTCLQNLTYENNIFKDKNMRSNMGPKKLGGLKLLREVAFILEKFHKTDHARTWIQ